MFFSPLIASEISCLFIKSKPRFAASALWLCALLLQKRKIAKFSRGFQFSVEDKKASFK